MIDAVYFDGRSSRRQVVRLSAEDGRLSIEGDFGLRREALGAMEIAEPMKGAARILRFADGAYCEVADRNGLAALLADAGHRESSVVRIQSRWRWALGSLAAVVAVAAAGYVWALPWMANFLAPRVPEAVSRTISEQTLAALDAHVLQPSHLSAQRQADLKDRLAALGTKLAQRGIVLPSYRLYFRSAPAVGPNAFALPNGDLVLFDELVALAKTDDEVIAVLAHELGHVRYRHGLRQLIQSTVVSSAVAVWLGDISSVATGLGALVLESRYSRGFEREADAYAAQALMAADESPELLAVMLQRLEEKHGARKRNGMVDAISSHPDTEERIAALKRFGVAPAK